MIEIVVGSENPSKLEAVKFAGGELWGSDFRVKGIKVASGVPDQPMDDETMIIGAVNRARNVANLRPEALYGIGMEGGMRVLPHGWFNLGWVCIVDVATDTIGLGSTVAHEVPTHVRELMEREHLELSDAVTELYQTDTVSDRDCSGVITNGLMPAYRNYSEGIVSAYAALQNNLID